MELGRRPTSVPRRPPHSLCKTKFKRPETVSPELEVTKCIVTIIIRVGRTSLIFVPSCRLCLPFSTIIHTTYMLAEDTIISVARKIFLKCTLQKYVIVYYKIIRKQN